MRFITRLNTFGCVWACAHAITHLSSKGLISIKNFDPNKIKTDEKSQKKYYLLYWLCGDQKLEIRKN